MLKHLLTILALQVFVFAYGQNPPKREFRGAWIATYANIDWPNRNQTPAQQQAALINILNHHKATGINAIFLQIRSQSDAMYLSNIEPWSADLNGVQGRASTPFWDPLQFAIQESRKRGMELHAWINPYRAIANINNLASFAANHVAKQHPEWLIATGNLRTLDPGIPEVRDHIINVITDILQRYDIDGIHFDDYFYPNAAFNDDATFNTYSRGFTDRADWRRDNVNILIKRVHETINALKPWVKFGISPSGIYRNSTNPDIGTNTSGLQHYVSLYADSRKWLQEGWIDYLAPQVYWFIGQAGANYGIIVPWWNNNTYGRHMYIGLAGYKVNDPAQGVNWANPSQIPNQVRFNRSLPNIHGQAVYNTSSLTSTTRLGFRDSLRLFFYQKPSLQPAMPWRDNTPPASPSTLKAVRYGNDSVVLNWNKPAPTTNEFDKVRQFVIYRSTSPSIDLADANNIVAITNTDTTAFADTSIQEHVVYYYTITALDRFHNESVASNVANTLPPQVTCPGNATLVLDASCSVIVPDYTTGATVVSSAGDIQLTQSPAPGSVVSGTGMATITITATDKGGNSGTCSFTLTKEDRTPPVINGAAVDQPVLHNPNHKMRLVTVSYTTSDNCGPVSTSLAVTSNEPENGTGDGDTGPDWEVVSNNQVRLRAERSGKGSGRVYTITITASDASGNSSQQSVTVTVPHDKGKPEASSTDALSQELASGEKLDIKVMQNPSANQFVINIRSHESAPLTLTLSDATGRIIETRRGIAANGSLTVGSKLRPGTYYAVFSQGTNKQTIKLVKKAN